MSEVTDAVVTAEAVRVPEVQTKYGELVKSLEKLGELEPGVVLSTSYRGVPEVLIVPVGDKPSPVDDYFGSALVSTVAIGESGVRTLDIMRPAKQTTNEWGVPGVYRIGLAEFFKPKADGQNPTVEEITQNLEQQEPGAGVVRTHPIEAAAYQTGEQAVATEKAKAEAEVRAALYRRVFQNVTDRSNQAGKISERDSTLLTGLSPTSTPLQESLSGSINTLVSILPKP